MRDTLPRFSLFARAALVAVVVLLASCGVTRRPASRGCSEGPREKSADALPVATLTDAGVETGPAVQECSPLKGNAARAMTLGAFIVALNEHMAPWVDERYHHDAVAFYAERGLSTDARALHEYAILRALLELTRDGGDWGLRWAITNKEPSSKEIWKGWSSAAQGPTFGKNATAVAECDELSALFAHLARHLGVEHVGLFYPTWNHVVAAWEPNPKTRVLVPTSQIFLTCGATFNRTTFDASKQKVIHPFPKTDLSVSTVLPAKLVSFLLDRVDVYGPASDDVHLLLRLLRAARAPSSFASSCKDSIPDLAYDVLGAELSCADRLALNAFVRDELGKDVAVDLWLNDLAGI